MCRFIFFSARALAVALLPQARGSTPAILALVGWLCVGCQEQTASKEISPTAQTTAPPATNIAGQVAPTNTLRSFSARGVIREFPTEGKTIIVRHEEIPGFMPRMTMEFDVRDTNELRGLQKGDAIVFLVKATEEESWIEGIRRASTNDLPPLPPAGPSAASLLQVAQLKPGDLLPDAELLAEDGRSIKLSDFHGRALAFTFIFTRCPLPNFCPRMNQHFSRARDLLTPQKGSTNWQFLSISFDPDFDKPGVLSRYAHSYRGQSTDRWLFASAPTNVLASMSPLLDFRYADEGGSLVHNLRTVVVDPQRRVFKQFNGNAWKAEDLAQAMLDAGKMVR
jgi:protein SCO1/2